MKRVLWIEDGALVEFPEYIAHLYARSDLDLVIARDATEGFEALKAAEREAKNKKEEGPPYDAVVVDLRLPPGTGEPWGEIYLHHHSNPAAARLGLVLLAVAFGKTHDFLANKSLPKGLLASIEQIKALEWPDKENRHRFGVLTVEESSEVKVLLEIIGIARFETKRVEHGPGVLLDLITKLLETP